MTWSRQKSHSQLRILCRSRPRVTSWVRLRPLSFSLSCHQAEPGTPGPDLLHPACSAPPSCPTLFTTNPRRLQNNKSCRSAATGAAPSVCLDPFRLDSVHPDPVRLDPVCLYPFCLDHVWTLSAWSRLDPICLAQARCLCVGRAGGSERGSEVLRSM